MTTSEDGLKVAVTIGDTAGRAAEVTLKACFDRELDHAAGWIAIMDGAALLTVAYVTGFVPDDTPNTLIDQGKLMLYGLIGSEDTDQIAPATRAVSLRNGLIPADKLFVKAQQRAYDVIVAMYHDLGHILMELLDFEGTLNVFPGIRLIRTSVDQSTASDTAGTNFAGAGTMQSALLGPADIANRRRERTAEKARANA